MICASPMEVEAFRGMIKERLGLFFEEQKLPELAALLSERMAATGCRGPADYQARLLSMATSREEWRILVERLTIGETYFFRNADQFRAFVEVALPDLLRTNRLHQDIRVLSAGCASGEEPYTLAILLLGLKKEQPDLKFRIQAIDVNTAALQKAREGLYSRWSLRQTPSVFCERFFRQEGQLLSLDPRLRSIVSFEELNLLDPKPMFWSPGAFDVVFCRNVLMYFSPDVVWDVVARLARSLIPGGFLFLGHAETLRGISQAFRLIQSHETFYYQRRTSFDEKTPEEALEVRVDASLSRPPKTPPLALSDTSWYEAINQASQRIAALAGEERGRRAAATSIRESPPVGQPLDEMAAVPWDLGPARKAMEEERFHEALDLLAQLPHDAETDPETLLLRAAVLTNCGQVAAARKILDSLLIVDQLNPAVHYLMALYFQQVGDGGKSVEHYRSAIYLDPNFAMPYLQLGRLARRQGHLDEARRDLRQALELLHREDAARILLFGGGIHRSGLLALCRAELRALGENR